MVRKRHPDVCEVTVRLLRDRYFGLRFERVASRDTLLDPWICRGPVERRMRGRIATNWRCSRIMTQHSHGTGGTTPPTEGTVLPRLQTDSRALMRSPGGPRASALHLLPCARNTSFDAQDLQNLAPVAFGFHFLLPTMFASVGTGTSRSFAVPTCSVGSRHDPVVSIASRWSASPTLCRCGRCCVGGCASKKSAQVVLAAEVGGRWSQETAHFLLHLANHDPAVFRACLTAVTE